MTKIKYNLRERSPALADAHGAMKKIIEGNHSPRKREKSLDESTEILLLCRIDLLLEQALTSESQNDINYGKDKLMEKIPQLKRLAQKYPALREPFKNYLTRLAEFSERDSRFQTVYDAYQQAFGGTH